jgi:hypothetical protein
MDMTVTELACESFPRTVFDPTVNSTDTPKYFVAAAVAPLYSTTGAAFGLNVTFPLTGVPVATPVPNAASVQTCRLSTTQEVSMTASNANVTPVVSVVVDGEVGFPVQAERESPAPITSAITDVAVVANFAIFDLDEMGACACPPDRDDLRISRGVAQSTDQADPCAARFS